MALSVRALAVWVGGVRWHAAHLKGMPLNPLPLDSASAFTCGAAPPPGTVLSAALVSRRTQQEQVLVGGRHHAATHADVWGTPRLCTPGAGLSCILCFAIYFVLWLKFARISHKRRIHVL